MFAGSLIVIVVSSAITSVAERPGRMPTMMPSSAPPRPSAIEVGFMNPSQAWPKSASPENIGVGPLGASGANGRLGTRNASWNTQG